MRSSKPLHAILGAYIPLSVLVLWVPLPGLIYGFFASPDALPVFTESQIFLAGFLSVMAASIYSGLMKRPMNLSHSANIRGAVIVLILS